MGRIFVEICFKKCLGTTLFLTLNAIAATAYAEPAPWIGQTLDGRACTGGDPRRFGPYDYRTGKEHLTVVERAHFTPKVELLQGGESTTNAIADIDYTLVRFPNHHRALYSAIRFSLGDAGEGVRSRYVAECYLQRANYFSPDDAVPHMLYGLYLHRLARFQESLEKYKIAEELTPQDANLQYNMGLVYFDSGNYEESLRYAKEAYSHGAAFPGLRRKLEEAGHWK